MTTNTIMHTIKQGTTHKATAEAIYTYLRDNPANLPADGKNTIHRLVVHVEGTGSALRIGELTNAWYDVFPDNVPWSEDALSRGAMFTKNALASDKPEDRAHVTSCIRTVLMRSLRYADKSAARRARHDNAMTTA